MSAWVLVAIGSALALVVLAGGVLMGVSVNRAGADRHAGLFMKKFRQPRATVGCLISVVLLLLGSLVALAFASYWFIQLVRGLSHGHPG